MRLSCFSSSSSLLRVGISVIDLSNVVSLSNVSNIILFLYSFNSACFSPIQSETCSRNLLRLSCLSSRPLILSNDCSIRCINLSIVLFICKTSLGVSVSFSYLNISINLIINISIYELINVVGRPSIDISNSSVKSPKSIIC